MAFPQIRQPARKGTTIMNLPLKLPSRRLPVGITRQIAELVHWRSGHRISLDAVLSSSDEVLHFGGPSPGVMPRFLTSS
jgi:hypothetical protein